MISWINIIFLKHEFRLKLQLIMYHMCIVLDRVMYWFVDAMMMMMMMMRRRKIVVVLIEEVVVIMIDERHFANLNHFQEREKQKEREKVLRFPIHVVIG